MAIVKTADSMYYYSPSFIEGGTPVFPIVLFGGLSSRFEVETHITLSQVFSVQRWPVLV